MLQSSLNNYFDQEINRKANVYITNDIPSLKHLTQGDIVYSRKKGNFYMMVDGKLIQFGGKTKTEEIIKNNVIYTSTSNNNVIYIDGLIEIFNKDKYIFLSQQYGQIIEPLRKICSFKTLKEILFYIILTDGEFSQKILGNINLNLEILKGNLIEIGYKIINEKLNVKINILNPLGTLINEYNIIINNVLESAILNANENNNLAMIYEMVLYGEN